MVKTELTSFDEIKKALYCKKGIFIMYEPSSNLEKKMEVYYSSCHRIITDYKDLFGENLDQKFDKSKMKFYHYNSRVLGHDDYPNARFHKIWGNLG